MVWVPVPPTVNKSNKTANKILQTLLLAENFGIKTAKN